MYREIFDLLAQDGRAKSAVVLTGERHRGALCMERGAALSDRYGGLLPLGALGKGFVRYPRNRNPDSRRAEDFCGGIF